MYREYKYRFVIAFIYSLVNMFNGMSWVTFAPITV